MVLLVARCHGRWLCLCAGAGAPHEGTSGSDCMIVQAGGKPLGLHQCPSQHPMQPCTTSAPNHVPPAPWRSQVPLLPCLSPQSKRASELEKGLAAWEENRLLTSGVVKLRHVDLEVEEEENRAILLVQDVRPPFLKVGGSTECHEFPCAVMCTAGAGRAPALPQGGAVETCAVLYCCIRYFTGGSCAIMCYHVLSCAIMCTDGTNSVLGSGIRVVRACCFRQNLALLAMHCGLKQLAPCCRCVRQQQHTRT